MSAKLAYRIQIYSAFVFALFLVVHLATLSTGFWGAEAFDRAFELVRPLYRNWFTESLLLMALLAHLGTSLYFWWRRPATAPRKTTAIVQTLAGFVLLIFLIGHVAFFRVAPVSFEFTPRFAYLWTSYRIWPTLFAPYYILLGMAGAFHLAYGLRQGLRKRETKVALALYFAVGAWMFALGVRLPMVETPPPDDATLRQYLKPYETFTPWLIDMGEDHELIKRYRSIKN